MDKLKDLNRQEISSVYNALTLLHKLGIPIDGNGELLQTFGEEMRVRSIRPLEEKVAWTIMSKGTITHTNLLRQWSGRSSAGDIKVAVASLRNEGKIRIEHIPVNKGKIRTVYKWIEVTTGNPSTSINSLNGWRHVIPEA